MEDYTNRLLVIVKYDTLHVCLHEDMKVWEVSALKLRVDVRVGGVLTLSIGADVPLGTHGTIDGVQNVVVWKLWPAQLLDSGNEVILQGFTSIVSRAN